MHKKTFLIIKQILHDPIFKVLKYDQSLFYYHLCNYSKHDIKEV